MCVCVCVCARVCTNRAYIGHCSHVMNVRFSPHNRWVLSVGGRDRSAMQWRVLSEAQDEVLVQKPQVSVLHTTHTHIRHSHVHATMER